VSATADARPEIVLIVAVADNGVIGSHGAIPWRLKSDQQRFKTMTLAKPVVMGRKTFISLRRPLPFEVVFRLEENHWNGTVAPQLVVRKIFAGAPRYRELHAWLTAEWKKPEAARDEEARAIFAELAVVEGGPRRDLLESPRFRALLAAEQPLARAA